MLFLFFSISSFNFSPPYFFYHLMIPKTQSPSSQCKLTTVWFFFPCLSRQNYYFISQRSFQEQFEQCFLKVFLKTLTSQKLQEKEFHSQICLPILMSARQLRRHRSKAKFLIFAPDLLLLKSPSTQISSNPQDLKPQCHPWCFFYPLTR